MRVSQVTADRRLHLLITKGCGGQGAEVTFVAAIEK